jgi:hypothetical protein
MIQLKFLILPQSLDEAKNEIKRLRELASNAVFCENNNSNTKRNESSKGMFLLM